MESLDIGFSTCPNDTFIFHAMLHGCINTGEFGFTPHLHDVEELNIRAFSRAFHITKLSFHAWLKLRDRYEILDSGAALGYGCGPLLVGRSSGIPKPGARIAVPGEHTTAWLLLKLWKPEMRNVEFVQFDNILDGVRSGKYDAGVIIHEGRFIYHQYDCRKIVDLGEWWEEETGSPIPLGCIALRKDHPVIEYKKEIELLIRRSVEYAFKNRNTSREYVKFHAQELDDEVIDQHIDLYVNDFTISLGDKGAMAVRTLEEMAQWKKIL
jgi:1,4-dihydroxy-6-naphthoate synthase